MEHFEFLKDFGFNSYEIKLLFALAQGPGSASELSGRESIPSSKIYAALETLQKQNFVIVNKDKQYSLAGTNSFVAHISGKIETIATNWQEKLHNLETFLNNQNLQTPEYTVAFTSTSKLVELLNDASIGNFCLVIKDQLPNLKEFLTKLDAIISNNKSSHLQTRLVLPLHLKAYVTEILKTLTRHIRFSDEDRGILIWENNIATFRSWGNNLPVEGLIHHHTNKLPEFQQVFDEIWFASESIN